MVRTMIQLLSIKPSRMATTVSPIVYPHPPKAPSSIFFQAQQFKLVTRSLPFWIPVSSHRTMLAYSMGNLQDIPVDAVDFVVIGNFEDQGIHFGQYTYTRPGPAPKLLGGSVLGSRQPYFTKTRPQYANLDFASFVNFKSWGAVGNGVADDTTAIQSAINGAAGRGGTKVIYLPPGSYIITKTLFIPAYVALTGQVWSQLVASGSFFQDISNPQPMVRIGNPGDVGTMETSDILFTSVGALPGLVLVEWNVHPGDVGIWDSHFRIGKSKTINRV